MFYTNDIMKNKTDSSTKSEHSIHLFVSLPTNDVCSLRDISTKLLVHQVKSKVELRVGIPGDLIHLFFMNNELADDKTLRDYKLKHGCILRVRLHKTWLGLFLACSKGDTNEVFQNGVQAMSEDSEDFDVELWNRLVIKRATFALFMATYHGYLSLMLELLNSSVADINGCTVFGRTSLHIAAFQGFLGCVSLLLSEGAVCNVLDVFGKTPLQLAYVNKHIFCQKRLFMHQSSKNGDDESHWIAGDRSGQRPKVAPRPHEIIRNFQEKQRTKKKISSIGDRAVCRKISAKNLPSITTVCKDPSISSHNHTRPLTSYDLPEMNIIDPLKTHHPEEEVFQQYAAPIVRAQTAPINIKGSETFTKSSSWRGIRGIDAILGTAQNDIVGEYHNIDESIADINVTTLRLPLHTEENKPTAIERKQPEKDTESYDHDILIETREQYPPNKRMLSFVLTAEENRSQNKQNSSYSEVNDHEKDKLWMPETNGCQIPEQDLQDGVSWTPTMNGYPEIAQPEDRLWTPAYYDNILESSEATSPHRKVASSLSFDEWLEKKRKCAKEVRTESPPCADSNVKSKVGREMHVEAFQKWLEGKKKLRRRTKSETRIEHHRASSGVPFDEWLRQKRHLGGENLNQVAERADPRLKQVNLGGKTFSEWLAEKSKLQQNGEICLNTDSKRNRSKSGKTFQEWLKDKNKAKQEESDLLENLATLELKKKTLAEEKRKLNPRVKTFEQWFEEKRAQNIIELVQSKNVPSESELLNSKIKFPEDASLVFDMWLTSKNMEELRKEEKLHEEMVEKWRRKEQERLQIRRNILSKLSQAKKEK